MANDVKFKLSVDGAQVVNQQLGNVGKGFDSLAMQAGSAAKMLGGMMGGFSAAMAIGKLVEVQRQFDVLNSSLITVTGSSAAAAKEMAWLKTFAKETPFGLAQATEGFVKMKALGLDPGRAALTSYGNTASAMGKNLNQMIEAVADASTGEFERLKEFGVKAKKEGDNVSLTFQGVTTTIGNNAKEITGYLEALGNNEFAGAMARRAETLDGAIAALSDTWDELFFTVSTKNAASLMTDSVTVATKAIEDAITIINSMSSAADANAKTTGVMATVQEALAVTFETVAVLGANVKYVLVQVGTELGGLAAQAVQILQGNFAGAAAIRTQMVADAAAARSELDSTTAAILMAREHAKTADTVNAQASARLARQSTEAAAATVKAHTTVADAAKASAEAAKKAAAEHEKAYKQTLDAAQKLADVRNKEYAGVEDYMAAESLRLTQAANASEEAVRLAQEEFDNQGKLKSEIAATTLARMQDQLATETAGTAAHDSLARQIDAQKRLIGILRNGEIRDAGLKAADDMREAQKKAAEESGKYWEDALMRAFESGKGFFDSLWSTIKNTLKTQVLKVMVQGTMGALGIGAAGAAAAGQAGGTDFLGLASAANGINSLYTGVSSLVGIGSQVAAGTMSAANALGTVAANATGTGISGLLATNGAYGTAAGAAGATGAAAGGGASAGLAAIPGWGWAAMAAVAAVALFGSKGGPKTDSSYNMGNFGDTSAKGVSGTYAKGVEDAWTTLSKQLGINTALKVGALVSADPQGDAQTILRTNALVNGQQVYSRSDRFGEDVDNAGRDADSLNAAMAEETTRILFAALKASDLPEQYKTYLNGIADNAGDMNTAIGNVSLVSGFTNALKALPFEELKNLSFNASKGLIEVAGGLENLQTNLGTYYTNFYSAEEQRLQTIKTINAATAGSGLDAATATRDQFRQLVEAQDLATESGRATYAALIGVSGAMGGVITASEALAKTNQGWQDKLDLMTGAETDRSIALRDATDNSTRAIMRQVYAQEDLAAATAAAAAVAQAVANAQDSAMSAYISAQNDYNSILAQEQADAAQAMQAAAQATAQAAESIRSAMANAGSGIVSLIRDLTTNGGGTLDPMALMRSTQRAYLTDLAGARAGDVDASGRVASSARAYIDANKAVSGGPRQAAIVAAIVAELGKLPAVKTYEQQLLDAVNGTTKAVGANATTVAAALNAKLTAELNVSARSEILKLINFVANTDRLPDDLKTLALAQASKFERTIGFVNGSALSDDNKRLALAVATAFVRTFNLTAGSTLSDDVKKQAFAAVTAFDRTINIVTGSTLSEDLKRQAFNVATAFDRSINIVATSNMTDSLKQQAFGAVTDAGRAINIVATSNMTAALVQQAFGAVTNAGRAIDIVATSNMTDSLKQQAFGTVSDASRSVSIVAGSTLTDDVKTQAFGAITDASRYISIIAESTALAEYKKTALDVIKTDTKIIQLAAQGFSSTDAKLITDAASSINKSVSIALGQSDPAAMAIALAQSATIEKTITASGGTLTPEQLLLINGIESYNKTIALDVQVDAASLTNAQQLMQSVFGTYNIGEILQSATGSTQLNAILGADQAARLGRIAEYQQAWVAKATMQNGGWNDAASRAVAFGIYGERPITGITQQELAEATGQSVQSMNDFFDAYGIPRFAMGTNYLPSDMLAQVHKGERIVPAADNRELMQRLQSPQENGAALAAEIRALRQQVADLERSNNRNSAQIASHVADSASTLRTIKNSGMQVWTDSAEPLAITGVDGGTP